MTINFNNRITLLLYSLILSLSSVAAQSDNEDIKVSQEMKSIIVIHERDNSGVTLRWVPSDPALWLIANRGGYLISRMTYEDEADIDVSKFKPIAKGKVKDKEAWLEEMKGMKEISPYLAGSYECIYGEYRSLKDGQGFSAWQEQALSLIHI